MGTNFIVTKNKKDIRTKGEGKIRTFIEKAIGTLLEVAVSGDCYHLIMAQGRCIIGFRIGLEGRFGMSYSSHFIVNPIWKYVMIDVTIVRAHACAAVYGIKKGHSRKRGFGGATREFKS